MRIQTHVHTYMLTRAAHVRCAFTLHSCILMSIQGIQHSITSVLVSCVRWKRKDERIKVKGGKKGINSKKSKSKERTVIEETIERKMSQSKGLATQKKDNCSGVAEQSQPTHGSKALAVTKVCTAKYRTKGTFWVTSTQLTNTSPYCKLVTSTPHSICWRAFGPHYLTLHT